MGILSYSLSLLRPEFEIKAQIDADKNINIPNDIITWLLLKLLIINMNIITENNIHMMQLTIFSFFIWMTINPI